MEVLCCVADSVDAFGKQKRLTQSWPPEQDSQLIELMNQHGVGKWKMIAKKLLNKSPKQC